MMLHDIKIVGAGPAGSRIAQRLSQLGYSVVVVDKNLSFSDDVCCTGILSQECLSAFGLDNVLVLRQASSVMFLSPSGEYLRLCRQSPVAAIVNRSRLNVHLAEIASSQAAPSYDIVPLKPLPRTYADRVLVVGEAAGSNSLFAEGALSGY